MGQRAPSTAQKEAGTHPKVPFYTYNITIPHASKLEIKPLLAVLQTLVPLLLDLAGTTRKKGSQEEDGEQEKEGKGGTWKFLLITLKGPESTGLIPGKA